MAPNTLITKSFEIEDFTFEMRIKNFISLQKEFLEENYSPPGSKDVWFVKVFKLAFPENATLSSGSSLKIEFGLVSRGDNKMALLGTRIKYQVRELKHRSEFIIGMSVGLPHLVISSEEVLTEQNNVIYVNWTSRHTKEKWRQFSRETSIFQVYLSYTPTDFNSKQETSSIQGPSLLDDLANYVVHLQSLEPDVSLVTKDGSSIMVSSLLLLARSDVFRTMLEVDMIERKNKKVDLPENSRQAIIGFVDFLANDKVDRLEDIAEELFLFADKYNVVKLKMLCEEKLASQVTRDNRQRFWALIQLVPSNLIMDQVVAKSFLR